jgi:hypothetical protein
VSHWLDDAAKQLAVGRHSRRDILLKGGAAVATTLLASVSRPFTALAAADPPCTPTTCPQDICCQGHCLKTGFYGCCHDTIYVRVGQTCCPRQPATGRHLCRDDEECCGKDDCCKRGQLCCDGKCLPGPADRVGCCNGATYDLESEDCCLEQPSGVLDFHVCSKDETCCGDKACCKGNEECCGSGGTAHCVPPGQCLCGDEPCTAPMHCCYGTICCTGPCCHGSCCVGPNDQCCHNNGGCCGPKDICCPSGCCIYGCTSDGGCAMPPNGSAQTSPRPATLVLHH